MRQQQLNFDLVSFVSQIWRMPFSDDDTPGYERRLLIALLRAADILLRSGRDVRLEEGFRSFSIKRTVLVDYAGADVEMSSATLDRCIDHLKRRGHRFVTILGLDKRPPNSSRPLTFVIDMDSLKEEVNGLDEEQVVEQPKAVDEFAAWAKARRASSSVESSSSSDVPSSSSAPSSSSDLPRRLSPNLTPTPKEEISINHPVSRAKALRERGFK